MFVLPRFVLLGLAVGAPWVFGAVQPQWQMRISMVIGALLLWRLIEMLLTPGERYRPLSLPTACLPALVLLLIGTVQLLPRDISMVACMEHAVLPEYATDATGAEMQPAGTITPATTRSATARLFFALAVFLLASQWFVTPPFTTWLCVALALNGAALGFFGIVQKLSWNGMIFWRVPLRFGGTPFASYVNRNNAAGCLNLCLAGAIALVALQWRRSSLNRQTLFGTPERFGTWRHRCLARIAQINGAQLSVVAMIGVILAAIGFSLSRGGILATGLGFLSVGLFSTTLFSRAAMVGFLALTIVSAAGLLYWLGLWGEVDQRLATLVDPAGAASGRLQHWQDTWGAVLDFPLLGTGLGAYRYANQPYQAHPAHAWYFNADNQYFEVLVETGIVGLAAFTAMFVLPGIAAVFLIKHCAAPEHQAIGVMGLFAVVTQAVQSLTDFGLIIPANGLVFALIAGTTCGTACFGTQWAESPTSIRLLQWRSPFAKVGALLVLTMAGGLFLLEMQATTKAALASEPLDSLDPEITRLALIDHELGEINQAIEVRPDDPELHRAAAMTWITRYRLVAFTALRSMADPQTRSRELWPTTSLGVLFARAAEMERSGDDAALTGLRELPEVDENLRPALRHLTTAQQLCPLIRDATLQLSLLAFLDKETPGDRYVRAALFIAPSTPERLFEAGVIADTLGQSELAETAWKRCLTFTDQFALDIWNAAIQSRPWQAVADDLIPDDPSLLVTLAEELNRTHKPDDDPQVEACATILNRAAGLLQNAARSSSVGTDVRARLAVLQGDRAGAIDAYRTAIHDSSTQSHNPREIEWRLTLAQLLLDEQRYEEAYRQYSLLLKLSSNRQQMSRIEQLMREVRRRREQDRSSPGIQ